MRASRSPLGWLATLAALAVAPKCALCVFAYVLGGAAALGPGRAEICGASKDGFHAAIPWLVVGAIMAGGGALLVRHHLSRRGPPGAGPAQVPMGRRSLIAGTRPSPVSPAPGEP